VNRNIYKLEYLKKNFNLESETQIRDSPARVEDKEMNQRSIRTQNQGITEQKGEGREEGETDKDGNTSHQERREEETPMKQQLMRREQQSGPYS
jgi:hypothetical protein